MSALQEIKNVCDKLEKECQRLERQIFTAKEELKQLSKSVSELKLEDLRADYVKKQNKLTQVDLKEKSLTSVQPSNEYKTADNEANLASEKYLAALSQSKASAHQIELLDKRIRQLEDSYRIVKEDYKSQKQLVNDVIAQQPNTPPSPRAVL